jgi:two-component system nitrogen regulation response regulator GlnG
MSSPPTLLVIDDEPSILRAFCRVFRQPDWNVVTAETGTKGLDNFQESKPDLVIMDVGLPDMQGLEVFDQIRHSDPTTPVVFITGHGTTETAIEAIKRGAVDYLFKPLELDDLRAVVGKALRLRLPSDSTAPSPQTSKEQSPTEVLVGRSPVMKEIYKSIGRVTSQNVTVLITGESGTGKELVARAIYQHSDRSGGPFLAINCAAICISGVVFKLNSRTMASRLFPKRSVQSESPMN